MSWGNPEHAQSDQREAIMGLKIGEPVPPFSLPATGQRTISTADLKERKAVLYFYPKDDTSGCTLEANDFQRLYAEFRAADTEIVGISPDGLKSHDKFCGKHGLEFPLASDEAKSTLEAFGVWVEKSMYGRKYMGVERTTVLLDSDGRVARIWPKVKVPGHAEEVLAAARAL
jgi:peroxiredoxin Q/BCP